MFPIAANKEPIENVDHVLGLGKEVKQSSKGVRTIPSKLNVGSIEILPRRER